jgi:inner membrane protein
MATILTHMVIPCAIRIIAGKKKVPGMLLFYACVASILPDIDVLSFKLAIPYESDLGHRGISHSFSFAILIGVFGSMVSRYLGCSKLTAFLVLFVSTLSHPLMDALTNGGHGVALLWPISSERFFFPWQPIEVSPIGLKLFFSERGLKVMMSEFVTIWLPCLSVVVLYTLCRLSFNKRM